MSGSVRDFKHWIEREGPVKPPKSTDFTPLDFYLWRMLKTKVLEV